MAKKLSTFVHKFKIFISFTIAKYGLEETPDQKSEGFFVSLHECSVLNFIWPDIAENCIFWTFCFFESFPQVSAFVFYLSIPYTLGMEVINTYGRMNPERYFLNK